MASLLRTFSSRKRRNAIHADVCADGAAQDGHEALHRAELVVSSHDVLMDTFPPIHRAAYEGNMALASQLVNLNHNVNLRSTMQNSDGGYIHDVTPLYIAAQKGDMPMVALLLAAGADPNMRARNDAGTYTPAEMALVKGHFRVWWRLRKSNSGPSRLQRMTSVGSSLGGSGCPTPTAWN